MNRTVLLALTTFSLNGCVQDTDGTPSSLTEDPRALDIRVLAPASVAATWRAEGALITPVADATATCDASTVLAIGETFSANLATGYHTGHSPSAPANLVLQLVSGTDERVLRGERLEVMSSSNEDISFSLIEAELCYGEAKTLIESSPTDDCEAVEDVQVSVTGINGLALPKECRVAVEWGEEFDSCHIHVTGADCPSDE